MKVYSGSSSSAPHILSPITRRRSVVSLMHGLLYNWGKNNLYPLKRRLDEPMSLSECFGEEKNLSPTPEMIHAIV